MIVGYWGRGIFAVVFAIVVVIVARILNAYGRRFLNHTVKSDEGIVQPVHILLNLGFYLLCIGLFLWNIGIAEASAPRRRTSTFKWLKTPRSD